MGISLRWLAVKGKEEQKLLNDLGLGTTGRWGAFLNFKMAGRALSRGWYLVTMNRCGRDFHVGTHLAQYSQNAEVLACSVEEHVMFSSAACWRNGNQIWSIKHAGDRERENLTVTGIPPDAFRSVQEKYLAKQAPEREQVDWYFEIPLDLAEQITGFKHDRTIPALDHGFKELGRLKLADVSKSRSKFWR